MMLAVARAGLFLLVLYASWMGMLLVHEAGHMLHAVGRGGTVAGVDFPLLGFSQTHVEPNPHPLLVAWGGPIWGSLLPLAAWLVTHRLRVRGRKLAQFFAGFCLIANGAYVALGWTLDTGDAADLRGMGTPEWLMLVIGLAAMAGGLLLWHMLGSAMDLLRRRARPGLHDRG